MNKQDTLFKKICLACAVLVGLTVSGLLIQLICSSSEAWMEFGIGFITDSEWDPVDEKFGALPSIVGTVATTSIALVVALPLAFWAALFITNARPWLNELLSNAIDLLAAIPSVIYGMWGLFVFAPVMQKIFPETTGFGLLTSGIILGFMVLPYICAIMREVFRMTPAVLRESAYGIGCTHWETAKDIVLRYGLRGILGGVFIGLGRALGETMAVLFVIGNLMEIPESIFEGGTTIAATLANNFGEATGLERSSLFALGLILLLLALAFQILAQYYLYATRAKRGEAKS